MIVQLPSGEKVLANEDQILMNSIIYELCSEFIRTMNGIGETDKINPEDDAAKKILISDSRDELKKKAKQNEKDNVNRNRLGKLISSVTWGTTGAATPFNRGNLHIYDLIDGVSRTDKKLNFNNNMVGLYSGCIDKKKIDFEKTYWSN